MEKINTIVATFVACDGKVFNSEEACLEYETKLQEEKAKEFVKKQMFDKPLPFFIRVWYYKTQKRMYVLKMCSKEMGGLIMANAAGTAQKMRRRKENHKFSRMMAVILGLIVTIEVMIAGGMIFNIDFHSADIVAVIMGFIVLYSGVVAVLTDN